jgi:uncharacterized protein
MKVMPLWTKREPFGTELAEVELGDGRLSANGLALGVIDPASEGGDSEPYRLEYRLSTTDDYVTSRLVVQVRGNGWNRAIDLRRGASGVWTCTTFSEGNHATLMPPGGDMAAVQGALDCDLALCPLTNSMPVLRHGLLEHGGPVDFVMAWVSVPDLSVRPSIQRYRFGRRDEEKRIVRFETLDVTFIADILFDEDGIVLDYPGLAQRLR